ncbi:MAG: ATP synthase subunit I [Armatimonadetes bacterium]|nr:ATP synthase subunit I [Candidatus Hippobium faecium]
MNRIKAIIKTSVYVIIIATLLFLVYPGWRFSLGVLVGGIIGLLDFWMIVRTMSNFRPAMEDNRLMLKFGLLFVAKTGVLLVVLGLIVIILKCLQAKTTTLGFIAGLIVIPLSVFLTAFRNKNQN